MTAPAPTTVRTPRWFLAGAWLVLPLLGAGAGALLTRVPGMLAALPPWVLALPFLPDEERLTRLAAIMGPTALIVLAVIGLLLGAFLALMVAAEAFSVSVGPEEVVIRRGDDEAARCPMAELRSAFVDDGELVLQRMDGSEPVRLRTDLDARALRSAFSEHGVSWVEEDPFEADFTRWLDGAPGLDAHTNAVLRERRRVLEDKDTADAAQLREEAAARGIVVRDRAGIQQWRSLDA